MIVLKPFVAGARLRFLPFTGSMNTAPVRSFELVSQPCIPLWSF